MRATCSAARPRMTAGIPGTTTATEQSTTLNRGTTPTAATWEAKSSMPTDAGSTCRTTALCGRRPSPRVGLLIVLAAGCGSHTGAGPGCRTNLGDGHRTITAAGFCMADPGCGGQDRLAATQTIDRSGRRHTYRSSDSAVTGEFRPGSGRSAGCRSVRGTTSTPGTDRTARTSVRSVSLTLRISRISVAQSVSSPRCSAEAISPVWGWPPSTFGSARRSRPFLQITSALDTLRQHR